jgi:DNA-binding response OmpR family regulator
MKVLVAEDKLAMADLLTRALRRDGHSVVVAYDGQEALELGRFGDFDLILLDIMLPRVDGFSIIRTLRAERRSTPTLVVSARDDMNDIVQGLAIGADDYLTKPFALDVLLARVRALGRRLPQSTTTNLIFEDVELNVNTRELRRNENVNTLTPTEFALMKLLMRRAGSIVSHNALIEAGWGTGVDVSDTTLYVFISMLRSKIGDPQYLHTVRSIGYSLRQ